jgi:hypothetical protein
MALLHDNAMRNAVPDAWGQEYRASNDIWTLHQEGAGGSATDDGAKPGEFGSCCVGRKICQGHNDIRLTVPDCATFFDSLRSIANFD